MESERTSLLALSSSLLCFCPFSLSPDLKMGTETKTEAPEPQQHSNKSKNTMDTNTVSEPEEREVAPSDKEVASKHSMVSEKYLMLAD